MKRRLLSGMHNRFVVAVMLLAVACSASAGDVSAAAPAKTDLPPHPGEPAAHRELNPNGHGTPARIYARQHPEGPARVEPVYEKMSKTDQWEMTLPGLNPDGKDAVLTLWIRDGAVVNGYTLGPGADNLFHYTSTYRLELTGSKLTGSIRIRFLAKDQLNAAECLKFGQERIAIVDVKASGKKISGSADLLGTGMRRTKASVSGIVYSGGRPSRPEDSLADGALWPGHRGPFGSGAALDKGHRLVDDLNKARPVWKCDQDLPDGRAHHSGGGPLGTIGNGVDWLRHSGAKCGPVVAGGRVYLYTMIPSGPIKADDPTVIRFDTAVQAQSAHDWMPGQVKPVAKLPKMGEDTEATDSEFDLDIELETKPKAPPPKPRFYPQRTMFCVGADDVVFCFDAKTGATLWKTVYPGASANYGGSKGGPQLCPFVWQDKIYVLGSTERIYCLDAKTGKEIWQGNTGWAAICKNKILQDCVAANEGFPRNRSMEYSLTVADLGGGKAVVVCSDGRGKLHQKDGYPYTQGAGLIGLDALTGKRLWQTEEGLIGSSTPVRWTHKGRMYILAPAKAVTCIDPANGKVLWSVPCDGTGMGLVADEDHMVCNVKGVATCFRITPEKAERLWSLPAGYTLPSSFVYSVIYRGHLYSTFKGMTCVRMSDGEIIADGVQLGGGHTGGGMFMIAGEGRVFSSGIAVTGVEENTKPVTGSPWRIPFAIGYLTPMDPALADGRFFIRDKTGLVCYDLRKGKE